MVVVKPFSMAPAPIMFITFLVGIFYALDALYGERRDRSILFWKSLPVSDRMTVMSKAAIPFVVLPLIGFLLSLIAVVVLLFFSTAVLMANGISPARLWTELRFVQQPVIMFYGLFAHVLWFAPIYGWLLLVSAWAKRTPVLWAVLPFVVVVMIERIAFGTAYFGRFLQYRWMGAMTEAFAIRIVKGSAHVPIIDEIARLTPLRFLTSFGLWSGLLFAALCLAVAVRLRRNREPI